MPRAVRYVDDKTWKLYGLRIKIMSFGSFIFCNVSILVKKFNMYFSYRKNETRGYFMSGICINYHRLERQSC